MRQHENKRTFSCFCILTARLLTYTGITAFVLIVIITRETRKSSCACRFRERLSPSPTPSMNL